MKKTVLILLLSSVVFFNHLACKNMAKTAVKHWTKKQIKKFRNHCTEKTTDKFGAVKAKSFCNCATNIIMEKYPKADDAMYLNLLDIISTAKKCVTDN